MTPKIERMEVYPVAGTDCMELNLSGAHYPYFTRNVVILTDSAGREGIGEVPGGEKITKALEAVRGLVVGTSVPMYKETLLKVRQWLDANIQGDVRGQLMQMKADAFTDGWRNFFNPSINGVVVGADGTCTVGAEVHGKPGSWGSLDDFVLTPQK